jgi:uncharacterized protein
MTTLRLIELTCPICHNHFTSQAVLSTDVRGGKQTDFREHAAGAQPLPYFVHLCPRCGYAGGDREFSDDAAVSPTLEQHIWDELAPRLAGSAPTASEKYEFAAKVARWQSAEPRSVAELLLRAAWCCVDEGDTEAERYFRRHAARAFEESLTSYDGVARDERASLTYLVGELWRRIGDPARAHAWFARVPDEITSPATQQWIIDAARRQESEPREWFA